MPLTFSVMHIGDPTKEPTFDNIVICSEELPLGPGHGGVVLDHIVIDDTPHTHDKGVTTPLWIEGLLAFSKANASIAATHQALKHLMIAAWTAAWHARDKKAPSAS